MAERGFIRVNGKEYIVEIASYHKRDITDFSPRVTSPEGTLYSELGLYQAMVQRDWKGGFGWPWQGEVNNGYFITYGDIDTRWQGMVVRFPGEGTYQLVFSCGINAGSTYAFALTGFIEFDGRLFAWADCSQTLTDLTGSAGGGGVFGDGGSGVGGQLVGPLASTTQILDAWTNGKYLFVSYDDDQIWYLSTWTSSAGSSNPSSANGWVDTTGYPTSDAWVAAGGNTDARDFKWIYNHGGFVFVGRDADSVKQHGNEIYWSAEIDLADLYGVATDAGGDVLYAGMPGGATIDAISVNEELLILRTDGAYKMLPDKSAVIPAIRYSDVESTANFRGRAIFNEQFVYSILGNEIYQWNGFAVSNITPRVLGDTWPYKSYKSYSNFVPRGNFLYALALSDASPTYSDLDLICFDGVTWHKLSTLYAGSSDGIITDIPDKAIGIYNYVGYEGMFISFTTSTGAENVSIDFPGTGKKGRFVTGFKTTGSHYLETSKQHAQFRTIKKTTPSILVEADNLSTGVYIEIFYKGDTDTVWKPWGGSSGITNIVTVDGLTELKRPTGHDGETLEYYWMQYQIHFITNDTGQTPRLTAFVPRVLMRPNTLWGWDVTIIAQKEGQHGDQIDERSAKQIEDDLKAARDKTGPVEFYDIYNQKYYVNVTAVNVAGIEYHGEEGPDPDVEETINISLVELG